MPIRREGRGGESNLNTLNNVPGSNIFMNSPQGTKGEELYITSGFKRIIWKPWWPT
jgi:hypothetical protein